jgi:capsular exopolysaccharide synthesis family protein
MSRIFDALQRSEAERSGRKLTSASDATELLRHAEHRAVSEWEAGAPAERESAAAPEHEVARNGKTASLDGAAPAKANGAKSKASAVAEEAVPRELPEIFRQFKKLRISAPAQGRLVSVSDRDSPAAEAFRLLAVRLRHLRRDRPLKKLLITSSSPQEGKSTCSANLACSLALRVQQRVLLVEGDIRRPSLSQMFTLSPRPGICEWLREERQLEDCIYFLEGPGLWFMPAGSSPSNPLEVLQSGRPAILLEQLTGLFDWIIVDSPPVLPLADTSVWSRLADGILLVVRQGTSEKRKLRRTVDAIESQKLIGALLNSSKNAPDADYYYSPRPSPGPD